MLFYDKARLQDSLTAFLERRASYEDIQTE